MQFNVQQINQGPVAGQPWESHGDTVYVTEWMASGTLDGQPVGPIRVQGNWKSKGSQQYFENNMHVGATLECDLKDVNNQKIIKLIRPKQGNFRPQSGSSGLSGFPGSSSPSGVQQNRQKQSQQLPYDAAVRLLGICIEDTPDTQIACELFQACVCGHVAYPQRGKNNENMQKQLETQVMSVMDEGGYAQRFNACDEVTLAKTVEMWTAANGDKGAFFSALNSALSVFEEEVGEDNDENLPF